MDANDYQKNTNLTAIYKDSIKEVMDLDEIEGRENKRVETMLNMSYLAMGLGEVGEIQNKMKKILRDKKGIIEPEVAQDLGEELGDVLYYVAQTADSLGIKLGDIANNNLKKLFSRLDRGVISGSGDNR